MTAENIHTAIAEVMADVEFVQKQKAKEGGVNYTFAGEAALISALRPAMVKAGIYMHVQETIDVFRETYRTANDKPMNRTAVRCKVRFTHAPSGSFIDTEAWGEGSDVGDKSTPKAMTGAYKYALRETFCIETGDDPDANSSDEQTRRSNDFGFVPREVDYPPPENTPTCVHGDRVYKSGSKDGKPWAGWFCPQGKDSGCAVGWVKD